MRDYVRHLKRRRRTQRAVDSVYDRNMTLVIAAQMPARQRLLIVAACFPQRSNL
ncbi:hypothetical protein [Rhodopseudomonas faecalis]|uniref:hypothetical protein n=1 Tax=Rhodopseudomonas faecalis TaxID=99655 RepID=UPI0015E88190|nr:hypothetical protein [Rhodopseudomonas faecalis]